MRTATLSVIACIIFAALTAYGALCVHGNDWVVCALITMALIVNAIRNIISE